MGRTDWKRLTAMTDQEASQNALNDPDNLPLDNDFLTSAMPTVRKTDVPKVSVTIRISPDVFNFFRSNGEKGYQTRINAVLEEYVRQQQG